MKKTYNQPLLKAICIGQARQICGNGSNTIDPGQPNLPAGAPRHNRRGSVWDDEDDYDLEEDYSLPTNLSPMG